MKKRIILNDEAGQYPGHGTPFSYTAGIDPYEKDGKGSIGVAIKVDPLLADTRPRAYLIDEVGVWNFDKKGTEELWARIASKKLNNGD